MRQLAFAVLVIACSSESPSPFDAAADSPPDLCACIDTGPATADAAADVPAADASMSADAPADVLLEASTDTAPDAPSDSPVDGIGVSMRCPFGVAADCFGTSVNLQVGVRRPDGTTLHCGACGNTCAAGSFCEVCQCVR